MKYRLRSLMIVVTLVCVVLGAVMVRVEYLRRWAEFHDREGARHQLKWQQAYESFDHGLGSNATEDRERIIYCQEKYFYHRSLANEYRQAAYRPWTVVTEKPARTP